MLWTKKKDGMVKQRAGWLRKGMGWLSRGMGWLCRGKRWLSREGCVVLWNLPSTTTTMGGCSILTYEDTHPVSTNPCSPSVRTDPCSPLSNDPTHLWAMIQFTHEHWSILTYEQWSNSPVRTAPSSLDMFARPSRRPPAPQRPPP